MPRHCYVLRVFTRGDEGGNPLGVVTDGGGVTAEVMQAIAADLGFSETIFLDRQDRGIPRVRIFTPTTELPFAGHPLVGMAWVLRGPGGPDRVVCEAFEVKLRMDGELAVVEVPLDQPVRAAAQAERIARLTGVSSSVSARWVDMPLPYLVLEAASPRDVAAALPPDDLGGEPPMVYLYAWESPDAVRARFFAPGQGVTEDPATGSAAVALAATLREAGRSRGRLEVHQGAEVGRPSTIHLYWQGSRAAIGGTVRKDEVRWLAV